MLLNDLRRCRHRWKGSGVRVRQRALNGANLPEKYARLRQGGCEALLVGGSAVCRRQDGGRKSEWNSGACHRAPPPIRIRIIADRREKRPSPPPECSHSTRA